MTHVVTAPLIAVAVSGEWRQLLTGAPVPSGVKSADLDRLEREGYIEKVSTPEPDRDDEQDNTGDVKPPAKSGPGSAKGAWREYAESVGVSVDESAERDDIIKAIAAAGKPTE
ncbi:MAG: hypothetical protein ACTIOA_07300 [Brachybacterium tyrofermentans]|uniref:hypothetical protein n=1 Tax=Brachybacterium tyrofermentans TaxID=47848 RepID=UPI000A1ABE82|nr:hypothetical protein FM103_13985 [Corynebacterium xerosis]